MALTAANFAAYARRSAQDRIGDKADTEILTIINNATQMLANERPWPWLKRRGYINFIAPYSTGTITLTNDSTTVSGSGTTFPATTAPTRLYVPAHGIILDVASRTNGTTLVLGTAWGGDTEATLDYVLFKSEYTLPDNLLEFYQLLPGQDWVSQMEAVTPEDMWARYNDLPIEQSYPDSYTVQQNYLEVWPWPSERKTAGYSYRAQPTPIASISSGNIDWPDSQELLLQCAIDVMVARRFGACMVGDFKAAMAIYETVLAKTSFSQRGIRDIPSMSELAIGLHGIRPPPWKGRDA